MKLISFILLILFFTNLSGQRFRYFITPVGPDFNYLTEDDRANTIPVITRDYLVIDSLDLQNRLYEAERTAQNKIGFAGAEVIIIDQESTDIFTNLNNTWG